MFRKLSRWWYTTGRRIRKGRALWHLATGRPGPFVYRLLYKASFRIIAPVIRGLINLFRV